MWDNHVLLRNAANTMLAVSVIAMLYGAAYYLMHLPGAFPLRSVHLSVAPHRVSADQVLEVLRTEARGNLFTVDIEHIRRSLEQLSWVRNVNIRREFPDSLTVLLEEHQALARWNDYGLVNNQGEVFVVASKKAPADGASLAGAPGTSRLHIYEISEQALPGFVGPEGTSAEVTTLYAEFSRQLAMLDLHAVQLVLSPRHAWQMRLNNGLVLKLGREDMQQRLARFVAVYPYSLKTGDEGAGERLAYIDLRYRNGFAVRRSASEKG